MIGLQAPEEKKKMVALCTTASNMKIILAKTSSIRVRNNSTVHDDLP